MSVEAGPALKTLRPSSVTKQDMERGLPISNPAALRNCYSLRFLSPLIPTFSLFLGPDPPTLPLFFVLTQIAATHEFLRANNCLFFTFFLRRQRRRKKLCYCVVDTFLVGRFLRQRKLQSIFARKSNNIRWQGQ